MRAGFRYGDMAPMAIIEFVDCDPEAKGAADEGETNAERHSSLTQRWPPMANAEGHSRLTQPWLPARARPAKSGDVIALANASHG